MFIEATDGQVIDMGKLAILASRPVGLGFLHHDPLLKEDDIRDLSTDRGLYIDYYRGRMVKFGASKRDGGYAFADDISGDYQSWIYTYPSYRALFEAVASRKAADAVGMSVE